jgi:transposase
MGKPYSLDFRKRVVAAVVTGGLSCNEAGKQFGVAVSTAIGWVRRQRETGSLVPGKMGGTGRRRFLANTVSGCWNGSRQAISPYAVWLPNSPNAG